MPEILKFLIYIVSSCIRNSMKNDRQKIACLNIPCNFFQLDFFSYRLDSNPALCLISTSLVFKTDLICTHVFHSTAARQILLKGGKITFLDYVLCQ